MTVRIDVAYAGDLQCTATHGPSGTRLQTDAPLDNGGKARTFSPTDLVAAALGGCMLTIMAKVAEARGWSIEGARVSAEKEMTTERPRRISAIRLRIELPAALETEARKVLEYAAHHCPVGQSLGPDTKIEAAFVYG